MAVANTTFDWRYPKRVVWGLVALTMGPPVLSQIYLTHLLWDHMPVKAILVLATVIVFGLLEAWLLRRIAIRITPEEVRFLWPFRLQSHEVKSYECVRYWGLDWVHIQRNKGRTYKQLLSLPGGKEFRSHLLAWLDRATAEKNSATSPE